MENPSAHEKLKAAIIGQYSPTILKDESFDLPVVNGPTVNGVTVKAWAQNGMDQFAVNWREASKDGDRDRCVQYNAHGKISSSVSQKALRAIVRMDAILNGPKEGVACLSAHDLSDGRLRQLYIKSIKSPDYDKDNEPTSENNLIEVVGADPESIINKTGLAFLNWQRRNDQSNGVYNKNALHTKYGENEMGFLKFLGKAYNPDGISQSTMRLNIGRTKEGSWAIWLGIKDLETDLNQHYNFSIPFTVDDASIGDLYGNVIGALVRAKKTA